MLLSCSCDDKKVTSDDLDRIEKYSTETTDNSEQSYADIANWLTPEEQYSYKSTDNSNNIIDCYYPNYFIKNDRIYYKTRINGELSFSYITLKTGESFSLCPDPLCDHTLEGGCKYLGLHQMMFSTESDDIFYCVKTLFSDKTRTPISSICCIDVKNGTISEMFDGYLSENNVLEMFNIRFITNNKLYITAIKQKDIKDKDVIVEEKYEDILMSIDLNTYEVNEVNNKYKNNEHGEYFFTDGKYIYFIDRIAGRLFATDMNFENETTILEYDGNEYSISSFYYDGNKSEIYICVSSCYMVSSSEQYMNGSKVIEDGNIYCIDENFNCSKLDMPSDKILEFKLTNEYFYYTVYDPIDYGTAPIGIPCVLENGNKIYRVLRDDTSEGELILDGYEKLYFKDYTVTGDFLYIDYVKFMQDEDCTWFRITGVTARIDMVNDTIKWLNLN